MTFWITAVAMAAFVLILLLRALTRKADLPDPADYDLKVYRDQLAEVERDIARGVIPDGDAERARTEIARRILSADAARPSPASGKRGAGAIPVVVIVVAALAGSLLLYARLGQPGYGDLALQDRIALAEEMRENRPDQRTAMAGLPPAPPLQDISEETLSLMAQLRETVAGRPDDLQGHQLLARYEAGLGNFEAAIAAQQTVLRLKGDNTRPEDIADFGEYMVLAAGGYVSPEAEDAFRAVLARDEDDGRSRYYLGLMMIQTGRPDIAFRLWDGLLRRGPADAPWIPPILAQIADAAHLAGVDYTVPQPGSGASRGPSAEDIEAASEMTAQERMDMIGGMVEGLSERLATEGGPPQDWARLITSLAVLGNTGQARAIFDNAVEVFGDDPGAMDIIRAAGSQAGVAE